METAKPGFHMFLCKLQDQKTWGKSTKHGGFKETISKIIYGGLQLGKSRRMKVFAAWSFIKSNKKWWAEMWAVPSKRHGHDDTGGILPSFPVTSRKPNSFTVLGHPQI